MPQNPACVCRPPCSGRLRSHFADHVDFRLTTDTTAAKDSKWCCQGFLSGAASSFAAGCSGTTDILQQTCGTFWLRRGDAVDGEERNRELQSIEPCELRARRMIAVAIEVEGTLKMSQSCGRLSRRSSGKQSWAHLTLHAHVITPCAGVLKCTAVLQQSKQDASADADIAARLDLFTEFHISQLSSTHGVLCHLQLTHPSIGHGNLHPIAKSGIYHDMRIAHRHLYILHNDS